MWYVIAALWAGFIAMGIAAFAKIFISTEPASLSFIAANVVFYGGMGLIGLQTTLSRLKRYGKQLRKDPRCDVVLEVVQFDVLAHLGPALEKHPNMDFNIFYKGKKIRLFYVDPAYPYLIHETTLGQDEARSMYAVMHNARRQAFNPFQSYVLSQHDWSVYVPRPSNHKIMQAIARSKSRANP